MRKLLTTLLLSGALIGSSVAGTAMALSPLPASATDTASAETTAIPEDAADYIIDKAADAYSEDLWEKALTFDMSVLQDNGTIPAEQASTGTVQFLIAGPQFYFRMSVKDPTRNPNDSPLFRIQVGDKIAQLDNGKYFDDTTTNEAAALNWYREKTMDLGKAVFQSLKYEDSTYIWTHGLNVGELTKGTQINVTLQHGDVPADQDPGSPGFIDGIAGFPRALSFDHVLYYQEYSEGENPEPPVYPEDPEPTPGPANPDYKIVIEDRAQVPRERDEDWENVPKYEMIPINGNSEDALADQGMPGATGTVQVLTSNGNIMFRVEIHDHTMSYADGRLIWFGNDTAWKDPEAEGALHFKGEGSYDMSEDATGWLSVQPGDNDFSPQPSLGKMFVDPGDGNATDYTGDGTYVYYIGYQIGDEQYGYDMSEGSTIKVRIAHTDSRHGGESWKSDNAFHTIYFEQTLTFGKEADKTIRPVEPEGGFTAERTELAYNKVTIGWEDMDGGETYRAMVYTVNPEGSEEPYTFLKQDNTFVGEGEIIIDGLNEKTEYVVQILVLDDMDNQIGASELIRFTTPGKNDPVPPEGGNEGGGEQDDGGCGSQLSVAGGVAFTVLIGAAAAAVVLIRKKRTK